MRILFEIGENDVHAMLLALSYAGILLVGPL